VHFAVAIHATCPTHTLVIERAGAVNGLAPGRYLILMTVDATGDDFRTLVEIAFEISSKGGGLVFQLRRKMWVEPTPDVTFDAVDLRVCIGVGKQLAILEDVLVAYLARSVGIDTGSDDPGLCPRLLGRRLC
jgi:hypothetical protein